MKRLVAIVAAVLLLFGAGVALWPEDAPDKSAEVAQPAPKAAPRPAPIVIEQKPVQLSPATIAGGVHRRGKGVAGATIIAKSERETLTTTTGEGGGFLITLPPDAWLLSATFEDEASRIAGPFVVGSGEQKQGVVLELLASATLEGVVLNEQSREPVANARVAAAGATVQTTASGRFQLKGISVGEAWVEVSAIGFLPRIEWVTVDAARALSGMEITLTPAGTVKGTVTRAGQPVAGASVWSEGDVRAVTGTSRAQAVTDLNGAFELSLGGGKAQLAASAPNEGRVAGPEVTVNPGTVLEGVQIELGQQLVVTGTVSLDADPAPNAQLIIFDARSGRGAGSAFADNTGRFAVAGLPPGTYLVQAKAGGVEAQRGPFSVTGDGGDHWEIVLEHAGAIHGRVVPPSAGVTVRLRGTDWLGQGALASTDPQGRFLFEGITSDSIVEAEGPGGYAEARAKPNEEVTLTLEQAVLRGSVTNERGAAVTDFAIRLKPLKGGPSKTHALLSPTGRFRIATNPGEYEVSAFAPGTAWAEPVRGVAAKGGGAEVLLRLAQTTPLDGRVIDMTTRAPVAGAEVQVRIGGPFSASVFASAVSNSAGTFRFGSVPLQAGIVVTKAGYKPSFVRVGTQKISSSSGVFDIVLQPGDAPEWLKSYEGVGLSWNGSHPQLSVAEVFVGSPAEEAGITRGDLLISVDGRSTSTMSFEQVINTIRGPAGTAVRLGFSRAGQPYEVTVRRRAISL